jgi:hypothetical protein
MLSALMLTSTVYHHAGTLKKSSPAHGHDCFNTATDILNHHMANPMLNGET